MFEFQRSSCRSSSSEEEITRPRHPVYRSQVLDHLGLVAGRVDERGLGEVIDHATQQTPELRRVTAGQAVKALVRTGLGCVNQPLDLVPQLFQNTPTSRLIAPAIAPEPLHAETWGRALETL
jgi:hypothetical protein